MKDLQLTPQLSEIYLALEEACNARDGHEAGRCIGQFRDLWVKETGRPRDELYGYLHVKERAVQIWIRGEASLGGLIKALPLIRDLANVTPDLVKNYRRRLIPTLAKFIRDIETTLNVEVPYDCFGECDVLRRKLYGLEEMPADSE